MKVKRTIDGKEVVLEVEKMLDGDVETDEELTVTTQDKNEKMLSQSEVNALLATERRKAQKKQDDLQKIIDDYQTKEQETENKLKERLEELKNNADPQVLELIEDAPLEKQIKHLEKLANVEKPRLPNTPKEKGDEGTKQKPIGVIF